MKSHFEASEEFEQGDLIPTIYDMSRREEHVVGFTEIEFVDMSEICKSFRKINEYIE